MSLTITDLFCGAGGSGLGAHAAGFDLKLAANHWAKAIETHSANFPDTEHDCADISQVDPRRYGITDVLWASPECTNHSQAKGKKRRQTGPDLFGETLEEVAEERSRATMWDVPRFAEAAVLRGRPYRAIVVENVVEAAKWIPFQAWLASMDALGYDHQLVSLNSMHAQSIDAPRAPQSRDRLYIVFHRKGQRAPNVTPSPLAYCDRCSSDVESIQVWKNGRTVGRYRQQYVYVCPVGHSVEPYALPAASAIDWTMPGTRIGDKPIKDFYNKKGEFLGTGPLAPKTMARIEAGLRKYGRPMTFEARGNTFVRMNPDGTARYARAWPVDQPTATFTTSETRALVVPYYGASETAQTAGEPIGTLTTRDRYALVVPSGGTWREDAIHDSQQFPTMTTRETDGVAFIAELRGGSSDHRPVTDPLCTVTASGNHHMLVRHNSSKGSGGEMCTPASEPARTMTTTGHQSIVSIEQQIEDATFRMLEPHEIQAAMAFRPDYKVLGTRRERVRQLGDGVTPPAAEFLLRAVAASLDAA